MKRIVMAAAVSAFAAGLAWGASDAVKTDAAVKTEAAAGKADGAAKPRVEVVFVIDTTGSMSGLIQAAKQKVWAIANTLATARPTPEIKMGLVAYRDRGDQYVTKHTKLTDDLDAVYADLMNYKAEGGGDTPESVNQALYEAVTQQPWSTDAKTYRVIFLVGDAPPHMNYADDVKYPETCRKAAAAGIVINAIQCGNIIAETAPFWTEIAQKSEGRYFRVEQSGSAIVASTPFDAPLAEASKKLDEGRVYYGDAAFQLKQADRARTAERIAAEAPAAAVATRASFNAGEAGRRNFAGSQELVTDVADGKVKLGDVKEESLPENLRKMSPKEREEFVAQKLAERQKLQDQVKDLAAKRQKFMEEEAKKSAGKPSLDQGIFDSIKEQAGKRGIQYNQGGPAL